MADGVDYIRMCVEAKADELGAWHPTPMERRLEKVEQELQALNANLFIVNKNLHQIIGEYPSSNSIDSGVGPRIFNRMQSVDVSIPARLTNLESRAIADIQTLSVRFNQMLEEMNTRLQPLEERVELEADLVNTNWGKF